MGNNERRSTVALDEAYRYCRQLETSRTEPDLFVLCNAISTIDLALAAPDETLMRVRLCRQAWCHVRDRLFEMLVTSFAGYFEVLADDDILPVVPGSRWPGSGRLDYYPLSGSRRCDSYSARLDHINSAVLHPLRWAFAEGRQQMKPTDFADYADSLLSDEELLNKELPNDECRLPAASVEDPVHPAESLLHRLYLICEQESADGKKKAHRRWWQLYWQLDACQNKKEKQVLQKQLLSLQSIWGRPNDNDCAVDP